MPITDHYARLPLNQIYIEREDRQRQRDINTKGLVESIALRGVLNPIIVVRLTNEHGQHRLVAGERRYQASCELGKPDIPVRFADELTRIEAQILELEENVKRQDLHWKDLVKAADKIHTLYKEMDPNWTQDSTAEALGLTKGTVSIYLTVASELDWNVKVQEADTVREAYNFLHRRQQRADEAYIDSVILEGDFNPSVVIPTREIVEEVETIAATPEGTTETVIIQRTRIIEMHDYRVEPAGNPAKNILLESFLHWAPKYTGPLFNFIHCDFPYGINIFEGPQAGGARHIDYVDSKETHFHLLECLLTNLPRLAGNSCHVMYWFSMQHYDSIRRMVAEIAPDLIIQTHPLIWFKTDNAGISPDSRQLPRHTYETALLMTRGRRPIVQIMADGYGAPSDKEFHIHTKPEPMLRHFFTMFVDEHTSMLDPTCGSGSSIRAAESLNAGTVVGMDTDESIVAHARTALRYARNKRSYTLPQAQASGEKFNL